MSKFNVLLTLCLFASPSAFAWTREAATQEVRAFCKAIDMEMAKEQVDQALDLDACYKSQMVVQFNMGVTTISGSTKINFPNHSSIETCSAELNVHGAVIPKKISCH